MSELRELYQEVILDHNKHPRNFHEMPEATCYAEGYNPLCGDQLTLYVKLGADQKIEDLSFVGSGCAISKASASLMTDELKGKSVKEAKNIFEKFHAMVTAKPGEETSFDLGKLSVLAGVCEFPARVKCASLAWHTLNSALKGEEETVTTE
ncbi:MAG: SUF system NifU family Fe-S cluster assembly protein [Deltaproteobacteria bacterium]|nr:SUF system NifU family Fe-S cluster assembly protein [Deltaproteobacteria bacterium]